MLITAMSSPMAKAISRHMGAISQAAFKGSTLRSQSKIAAFGGRTNSGCNRPVLSRGHKTPRGSGNKRKHQGQVSISLSNLATNSSKSSLMLQRGARVTTHFAMLIVAMCSSMIHTISKQSGAPNWAAFKESKLRSKSGIIVSLSKYSSTSSRDMLNSSDKTPWSSSSKWRLKQRRVSRGIVNAIVDAGCNKQ